MGLRGGAGGQRGAPLLNRFGAARWNHRDTRWAVSVVGTWSEAAAVGSVFWIGGGLGGKVTEHDLVHVFVGRGNFGGGACTRRWE